jgi:membrane peptidoglycan carboxypeptidase
VLAYYGGPNGDNYAGRKDYFDYAGLGSAAPGSSFKPYTLATALQQTVDKKAHGRPLAINSVVDGSFCTTIQGTRICNDPSDRQYSSKRVTVANAMKYSLNTTFDQMAAKVGPSNVAAVAHAAGISKKINGQATLQNPGGTTAFGIGIGDYPVHPIDQAVGFATFENGGTANAAYFVEKATASDGSLIYKHKATPGRAVDQKVANDVTMTLEPVASFSGISLAGNRPSASKTGTEGIETGKFKGGNSDAWTVGYTPQVSVAVWVGSGDSTHPIYTAYGAPEYGRDLPGRTWKLFMDTYLAGKPQLSLPNKQLVKAPHTPAPSSSVTATHMPTHSSTPTAPPTTPTTSGPPISSGPPTSSPPSSPSQPPSSAPPSSQPPPSCTPGIVLPNCPGPTPGPSGSGGP